MKSTWWIQHKQQKKLPQAELYPGVCELAWVKQTCYVQVKNSNDNHPPPQELYFNHHNYVPLPRTAFGGAFVIFLSMSHMCSRVPGWQAEVAGSCSWWLLAQPEATRTGRLGGSLALGFLAHHFLSQRHDEGGQGGWMLVGFKLNGCHSCWAPTGKALAACLRRILLPCFMCIHIYI